MKRLIALSLCLLAVGSPALAAPAKPAAATDVPISDLRFEPAENALYLPFDGPRPPIATIASKGQSVVIDIPRADFPFAEWYDKIERSPLIRALVAAYDPQIRGIHLVIEGHVPLTAEPDLSFRGQGMRFLILPKDPKHVVARPMNVTQQISVVPRDGSAQHSYSVGSLTRQWEIPAPRLSFSTGPTTEQFAPEGLLGGAQGVGRFMARWEPSYGEFSLPLRLGRGGYVYADPDYAGVDHRRAETTLELAVARHYDLGPVQASSGFGYASALTQVQNSATAPTPTFFFAGYQAMHGPHLRQTFSGMALAPLGLGLELGWSPYVFAHVDGGTTMPWLTAFRVEPRLYLFSDERLSLGYFYERTVGSSFNRESSGVTLGMSFSGF